MGVERYKIEHRIKLGASEVMQIVVDALGLGAAKVSITAADGEQVPMLLIEWETEEPTRAGGRA